MAAAARSSPVIPIFLIVLVDILGLSMLVPLTPFYARSFGASAEQVGALMSVYALFALLSGPPLGSLSDRYGRKPVLLVSQLGTFLSLLLMAYAPTLLLLFVARIVDGATAGNITVAQAYIADVSRPSERAKSFGLIGIAFGIGFLVGPASTAFLSSQFGDRAAVLAAAGLSATSLIATLLMLPAKPPRPEPEPGGEPADAAAPAAAAVRRPSIFDLRAYLGYFRRPSIGPLLWQFFAFQLAFSLFFGGFALYAEQRFGMNTTGVSYSMAWAGFLGILVQGVLLQRMLKALGESRLMVIGFLALIASMTLIGMASSVPLMYTGVTALAFTGFLRPVISSLLSRRTSPLEQGAIMGLTQSLSSVTQILGPLIAGVFIGRQWLTGWGLLAAAIGCAGLFLQRSASADLYTAAAVPASSSAAAAAAAGAGSTTTTRSEAR